MAESIRPRCAECHWTMEPGSSDRCLSCALGVPKGSWSHPETRKRLREWLEEIGWPKR